MTMEFRKPDASLSRVNMGPGRLTPAGEMKSPHLLKAAKPSQTSAESAEPVADPGSVDDKAAGKDKVKGDS